MVDTVIPFDHPEKRGKGRGLRRKGKLDFLEAENAKLKALLELDKPVDEDSWGEFAPQEVRDQVAACALIDSGLHPLRGLQRLGFELEDFTDPKWKEIAHRIFSTPGVQAILAADSKKFIGNKDEVQGVLYQIITNPLVAPTDRVRAASQLAKMIVGWQDGEKAKNPAQVLNFLMHVTGNSGHGNGNGARIVDPAELPPGEDGIVDAESFFVERGEEVVAVMDDEHK